MPTAATSATLIPPYHSEIARTARRAFSQYGTEEALVRLLEPLAGTLALYAHRLPPETAGVGVRVTRLLPPERDAFPVWRGEADSGVQAPDGRYAVSATVSYLNGDEVEASAPTVLMDRVFPKIEVSASLEMFSPNAPAAPSSG